MTDTCVLLHSYRVVGMTHNPPPKDLKSAAGFSEEAHERLLYGFTTVTKECRKCKAISIQQVLGNPPEIPL